MPNSKRIKKREGTKPTTETSKLSLKISFHDRLISQIRALPRQERKLIGEIIERVRVSVGQPHLHQGLGIRKLKLDFYECRCGLKIRLVFKLPADGTIYFRMLGTHDDVDTFLKSYR